MDEQAVPDAIHVSALSKQYSNRSESLLSLKNVSFDIPLGQICCLLGPNGSGKTTLLKILAGLLVPTSGNISIMGVDPAKDPRAARALCGWMPAEERSGFYGRLTGRQNLNFFGALQGLSGPETTRVIGNLSLLLGLNDELEKTVLTMSAGAKQKVGLARALLQNPAVLLLDEPLRNLDPHTVVRFRRLIKDHLTKQQQKTVLLSTHQLEEARRVADMVIILKDGQIVRILEARELESEARKSSVEEFYLKTVDAGYGE